MNDNRKQFLKFAQNPGKMRVAVTGASGHVGVNLCHALLDQGFDVRALMHIHHTALEKLPLTRISGNVLDTDSLRPLVKDAEIVFHLAARISITGDQHGLVRETNETGTRNLLKLSKEYGVRRFIHFSSIHAFDQHPLDQTLDESRSLVTRGFSYDLSKAAGEKAVMEYADAGLNAIVLCPTAIIGPSDPEPSLTGKAILQLIKNKIPALVPGGYNWVDVRDIVSTAINAMEHGRSGQKYLISGHWHSLKELSGLLTEITGKRVVSTVLPFGVARLGLPFIQLYSRITGNDPLYTSESLEILANGNKFINHSKATLELLHKPRPLKETLTDLINWFNQNNFIHL